MSLWSTITDIVKRNADNVTTALNIKSRLFQDLIYVFVFVVMWFAAFIGIVRAIWNVIRNK